MGNRMEKAPAYRFLTAALLTVLTSGAGAYAAPCCELPDAGYLDRQDTGQAAAQEAWVDLRVDNVQTESFPYGSRRNYATLHVLAKRAVDTSLFFQVVLPPNWPERWITSFEYDTAGFPAVLVDSAWNLPFSRGDTLRNVFVARILSTTGRTYLTYGGIQCKPITPVPGPFPIGEALQALDRFRDSLAAEGGQPPHARVRIGPIFIGGGGDPGLLVRAEASGDAWLIRYQTGSGDCLSGCTEHVETVYRVSGPGKVEVASSRHFFAVCWSPDFLRPRDPRIRPASGRTGCYTPDGRMLPGNRPPDAALPWVRRP